MNSHEYGDRYMNPQHEMNLKSPQRNSRGLAKTSIFYYESIGSSSSSASFRRYTTWDVTIATS